MWKDSIGRSCTLSLFHVPRSFTHLRVSNFSCQRTPSSLCRFLLSFLEDPFLPDTKLFPDLLVGNSLIVGVCKQQEKATWPGRTASFPFSFVLPPDGSEITQRISCIKITSPNDSTSPSDHTRKAICQHPPTRHRCFPCLIFWEWVEKTRSGRIPRSQSCTVLRVRGSRRQQ